MEFLVVARAREGWGKGNTFYCGAFREAKYEIRRRRKSEGGQKFLPPKPPSFLPARAEIIKIQRPDFRGKKFGFRSRQATNIY